MDNTIGANLAAHSVGIISAAAIKWNEHADIRLQLDKSTKKPSAIVSQHHRRSTRNHNNHEQQQEKQQQQQQQQQQHLQPRRDTTSCEQAQAAAAAGREPLARAPEQRRALITGINGQVGSYLAELLIGKGYQVHGMIRRESSLIGNNRLDHLFEDRVNRRSANLELHYGDLTDGSSLLNLIVRVRPHEIYNLAAQSHVKISFDLAEATANTNALGTLRLLEAIRQFESLEACRMDGNGQQQSRRIRFYQASTSELFGGSIHAMPQNERTPFYPKSPYACSKLFAHSLVVNYRESYDLFAANGILFNHESPRRGENFVTRKISRSVAEIRLKRRHSFELGNLDTRRDWGHARDYVEAIWLMMQQTKAKDYVIASGESHSVREFVELAFAVIGEQISWTGSGLNEFGINQWGSIRVRVSERFFRPAEVDHLLGDASLARKELGWQPKISFESLVKEMVLSDIELLGRDPLA